MPPKKAPVDCKDKKKDDCSKPCKWIGVCHNPKEPITTCSRLIKDVCVEQPQCMWDKQCKKKPDVVEDKPKSVKHKPIKLKSKKDVAASPVSAVLAKKPKKSAAAKTVKAASSKKIKAAIHAIKSKSAAASGTVMNKLKRIRLRLALKKALKPLIGTDKRLTQDRAHMYEVVSRYIEQIPSCLSREIDDDSGKTTVFLGSTVDLTTPMGSPSNYGVVYLSSGKGFGRLLKVATKVTALNSDTQQEAFYLGFLRKFVLNNEFPHFPIMYDSKICAKPLCTPRDAVTCPSRFLMDPYMIIMNELADGDLKGWLEEAPHTVEEVTSAMFQIIMTLFKFAELGYVHNDAHWGNFLYHKVKPGGYWWYQVDGQDFYIRNTGQMWVLWDFGMVEDVYQRTHNDRIDNTDVMRITHAFMRRAWDGWLTAQKLPKVVTDMGEGLHQYCVDNVHIKWSGIVRRTLEAKKFAKAPLSMCTELPAGETCLNAAPYVVATQLP